MKSHPELKKHLRFSSWSNLKNTAATIAMFELFADLIAYHLDAKEQIQLVESKLLEERKIAEIMEQTE